MFDSAFDQYEEVKESLSLSLHPINPHTSVEDYTPEGTKKYLKTHHRVFSWNWAMTTWKNRISIPIPPEFYQTGISETMAGIYLKKIKGVTDEIKVGIMESFLRTLDLATHDGFLRIAMNSQKDQIKILVGTTGEEMIKDFVKNQTGLFADLTGVSDEEELTAGLQHAFFRLLNRITDATLAQSLIPELLDQKYEDKESSISSIFDAATYQAINLDHFWTFIGKMQALGSYFRDDKDWATLSNHIHLEINSNPLLKLCHSFCVTQRIVVGSHAKMRISEWLRITCGLDDNNTIEVSSVARSYNATTNDKKLKFVIEDDPLFLEVKALTGQITYKEAFLMLTFMTSKITYGTNPEYATDLEGLVSEELTTSFLKLNSRPKLYFKGNVTAEFSENQPLQRKIINMLCQLINLVAMYDFDSGYSTRLLGKISHLKVDAQHEHSTQRQLAAIATLLNATRILSSYLDYVLRHQFVEGQSINGALMPYSDVIDYDQMIKRYDEYRDFIVKTRSQLAMTELGDYTNYTWYMSEKGVAWNEFMTVIDQQADADHALSASSGQNPSYSINSDDNNIDLMMLYSDDDLNPTLYGEDPITSEFAEKDVVVLNTKDYSPKRFYVDIEAKEYNDLLATVAVSTDNILPLMSRSFASKRAFYYLQPMRSFRTTAIPENVQEVMRLRTLSTIALYAVHLGVQTDDLLRLGTIRLFDNMREMTKVFRLTSEVLIHLNPEIKKWQSEAVAFEKLNHYSRPDAFVSFPPDIYFMLRPSDTLPLIGYESQDIKIVGIYPYRSYMQPPFMLSKVKYMPMVEKFSRLLSERKGLLAAAANNLTTKELLEVVAKKEDVPVGGTPKINFTKVMAEIEEGLPSNTEKAEDSVSDTDPMDQEKTDK